MNASSPEKKIRVRRIPACRAAERQTPPAAGAFGRRAYDKDPDAQKRLPFRRRRPVIFWGGLLLALFFVVPFLWKRTVGAGEGPLGKEYIGVVRVEGVIADTAKTLDWIERLGRDPKVKGVLVRVNSPGGGAAASHELHDALKRLGARKPVYASMGSVAASGGLMAALAASKVYANPATVTGSIGVKMEIPQFYGLMEKLGLGRESLASGKYKDAGTPFRPMTEQERAYLDGIIAGMHKSFVELVAKDRKLSEDAVRAVADGRVFTGAQALELGIIDELGGQGETLAALRVAAGASPTADLLERPVEGKFVRDLLQGVLGLNLDNGMTAPEFLYIY